MAAKMRLSLILPIYNNLPQLRKNFRNIYAYLRRNAGAFEIIIAEDGSTDGTDGYAHALAGKFGNVVHLHSAARLGRGEAIKRSVRLAKGRVIGYVDIDLATGLRHIAEAVGKIENGGYDVVVGSRLSPGADVRRSPMREMASRMFNFLVRWALGSRLRDHQCGFKFFSRAFAKKYAPLAKDGHWFWDTEMLLLAQRDGKKVCELPVRWREAEDTTVKLWGDAAYMGGNIIGAKLKRL